jgi:hypothetical protein
MPDRKRKLFWAYGSKRAMREGPWKLWVDQGTGSGVQLFHLSEDISEQTNLYDHQLLKSKRMLSDLREWHANVLIGATAQPLDP